MNTSETVDSTTGQLIVTCNGYYYHLKCAPVDGVLDYNNDGNPPHPNNCCHKCEQYFKPEAAPFNPHFL